MNSWLNLCPECAAGKCINCANFALNEKTDEIVPCDCKEAGHPR